MIRNPQAVGCYIAKRGEKEKEERRKKKTKTNLGRLESTPTFPLESGQTWAERIPRKKTKMHPLCAYKLCCLLLSFAPASLAHVKAMRES